MMHDIRPQTVLLADDEHTLRENLAEVLRDEHFDVIECEDGMAALKALRKIPVDAIITDLRMPRITGMELIEYARELAPAAVIIVVTAFGEVDTAVESMKLGAIDYISKPLILDEVIFKLKRSLAQVELERENERLRAALRGTRESTRAGAGGAPVSEGLAHSEVEAVPRACSSNGRGSSGDPASRVPGVVSEQEAPARSIEMRLPLREATRAFERDYILRVLDQSAGNKHEAARRLGIGLSSLYRKMDEFTMSELPPERASDGQAPARGTGGGGVS